MKVAVSSTGADIQSAVDQRFGRARWFLVFDSETGETQQIDNLSSVEASSGAGVAAAQKVVDAGAERVLTGQCGPKAASVLSGAGITITEGISGSVADAIDSLRKGEI